jgi:photosystem II stability/assembly factor-like uncharacterized protein
MAASDDAWAVESSGTILHWDGSTWTRAARLSDYQLRSVALLSASEGWAVGDYGTMLHFSTDLQLPHQEYVPLVSGSGP